MHRSDSTAEGSLTDKLGDSILVVAGLVAGTVLLALVVLLLAGIRESRRPDAMFGGRDLAVTVLLLVGAGALVVLGGAWWALR